MENINEIKKALYKEKPIAIEIENISGGGDGGEFKDYAIYVAECSLGKLKFKVPYTDMGSDPYGNDRFDEEVSAQLLIRWLVAE